MSRFLKIALFSTMVLGASACGKKGGSAMWDKMGAYADNVCKCKDMDCITKAGEQWAKDAAEIAKESGGKAAEMSADDKKKSEEITKKITDCTKKVTDEMMKKAQAGSGDAKKDEPKADEPKKDEPKKDEPKKDEPKAAEDTELQKKSIEMMTKVGDVVAANEKDCKKMGAELKKIVADNKATIDEMNAWEKKEPAAMKAFMEKHKADMETWAKKVEPGHKACEKDAEVAAAFKALE